MALTTLRPLNSSLNHSTITKNLTRNPTGLGITYAPPTPGGRTRKDGKEVKWEITRPMYSTEANTPSPEEKYFPTGRIDVPFFCHDVTPRILRVPWDDEILTQHKAGVTGIKTVEFMVPGDKLTPYSEAFASITGSGPQQISDGKGKGVYFELVTPTSQAKGPRIVVRVAEGEEDEKWLAERGLGIRKVILGIEGRKGHGEEDLGQMSLVW
jgi:hypothetical protein